MTEAEAGGDGRSSWSRAVGVISAIGPPVTVATALLFYFGWARADAQAAYMGLNVSLFGYTVQDYLLISINALFLPLVCILAANVAWLALDRLLRRRIEEGRGRAVILRAAGVGALVSGLVVGVSLVLAVVDRTRTALFSPYLMALGVLAATWCVHLRRLGRDGKLPSLSAEQRAVETTLILSIVTLLLFWGTADYAQALGRRLAVDYERGVQFMPRAEVYSPKPLGIGSGAVTEVKVGNGDAPLYRYDGLRLLVLSGGRFFFLHDGWTPRDGTVIVLPDDNSVRIEFRR
ncbi:hypothetical protein FHJ30_05315 [Arthrobacter sp. BB-1]|uniref:hypothetical protein n=1 Tax=unclassified Arthrobacter TaxID=235627 RepID=UPI001111A3BF|nr:MULTISPECIES: hypothetical protein [unclassified Arthrobacter]TNB74607.1 hypothetical protein FHJ30_05315 [Arthrobacter sp. BB-1]